MKQMLQYSPSERVSAQNALQHPYFVNLFELDDLDEDDIKIEQDENF